MKPLFNLTNKIITIDGLTVLYKNKHDSIKASYYDSKQDYKCIQTENKIKTQMIHCGNDIIKIGILWRSYNDLTKTFTRGIFKQ